MLFLEISEHKFLNKDLRTHCEIPSENVTFLHYSEQKVKKHKVKSKKWYNKMKQINHNDIHVDRVVTNKNKTNIGGGGVIWKSSCKHDKLRISPHENITLPDKTPIKKGKTEVERALFNEARQFGCKNDEPWIEWG